MCVLLWVFLKADPQQVLGIESFLRCDSGKHTWESKDSNMGQELKKQ